MASDLPIYYSKNELTSRLVDYGNVIFLPLICLFGIGANLTNIILTLRIAAKDTITRYILTNSIIDVIFLLTKLFLFIVRCGALCPYGYSYGSKIYEVYVFQMLSYIMVTFQSLQNVYFAFERLKFFKSNYAVIRKLSKNRRLFTIIRSFMFLSLSIVFNVPFHLKAKEIHPIGICKSNETMSEEILYDRSFRYFLHFDTVSVYLSIILFLKGPALYVQIGILHIIIAIRLKRFIKRKESMLNQNRG